MRHLRQWRRHSLPHGSKYRHKVWGPERGPDVFDPRSDCPQTLPCEHSRDFAITLPPELRSPISTRFTQFTYPFTRSGSFYLPANLLPNLNPYNPHMQDSSPIVSFDNEPLLLVDSNDVVIGFEEKAAAHHGEGKLHRAFSIFLLNDQNEVLLQKRSPLKPLWPNYWSNTCCSHPRRGESLSDATKRRLKEELNLEAPLTFLFKFQYHATFGEIGSEHELCSVFIGRLSGRPKPVVNETEISDTAWVSINAVKEWLSDDDVNTSPWFALEWELITTDFAEHLTKTKP